MIKAVFRENLSIVAKRYTLFEDIEKRNVSKFCLLERLACFGLSYHHEIVGKCKCSASYEEDQGQMGLDTMAQCV